VCFLSQIDRLKQTSKEQDQNLSRQKEDVRKLEASLQKSQARVTSLEQKIIRNASLIGYTVEDVDSLEEDEEWEVSDFVEHLINMPNKRQQIVSMAFCKSGFRGYDFVCTKRLISPLFRDLFFNPNFN